MLLSIDIRNFAIIKSLQLDWQQGMSVITGETGAGKSIVIDALSLALGERADKSVIYPGAKQAEVSAEFEISSDSAGYHWLDGNDLLDDGQANDSVCIVRRIINQNGRSKCYINGRSTTQSQQKELASLLVDIHGQHAQQSLLKNKEQLSLLDRFANHPDLLSNVLLAYKDLNQIKLQKKQLQQQARERDAKRELLIYQVDELATANPDQQVLDQLENEHRQAASSNDRQLIAEEALMALSDQQEVSSLGLLRNGLAKTKELAMLDPSLQAVCETLTDAEALLQDANNELSRYRETIDCDSDKLAALDRQLEQFHDLARKHHVSLTGLPEHFAKLSNELVQLQSDDQALEQIEQKYQQALKVYLAQAKLLTASRVKTADKLASLVTKKIQPLAMEGGKFAIQVTPKEQFSELGMEEVEYLISANPGLPLQPLTKVASGGELSRISLAISTITSEYQLVPCIIFDEVDVGIGGATAEIVGDLLKTLANKKQVLCVTHQPQVASCGDHHWIASKTKSKDATHTELVLLDEQQRVDEIARMLGGKVISEKTISHAKEMLNLG